MATMHGKREMHLVRGEDGTAEMVMTVDGVSVELPEGDSGRAPDTEEETEKQIAEARRIVEAGRVTRLDASRFLVRSDNDEHEQTVDVCWVAGADVEALDREPLDERIFAVDCSCQGEPCIHQSAATHYLVEWA